MTPTLNERVSAQAARTPDSPAVVMGDETLDYRRLDEESNRLAHCLRELGCERGDRVCLFLPKSPAAIVAMLGALKAGCAYVPVDLDSPATRLAKIVADADPRIVLVAAPAAALLDEVREAGALSSTVHIGSLGDRRDLRGRASAGTRWRPAPPSRSTLARAETTRRTSCSPPARPGRPRAS